MIKGIFFISKANKFIYNIIKTYNNTINFYLNYIPNLFKDFTVQIISVTVKIEDKFMKSL